MKKRRILRSERGFTLVELGIVMAIIAILAAVAYPTYSGMRKRAYIAEANAIMQEIRVEKWAEFVQSGETTWQDSSEFDDTDEDAGVGYNTQYWRFKGEVTENGATFTITAEPQGAAETAGAGTQTMKLNTTGGKVS